MTADQIMNELFGGLPNYWQIIALVQNSIWAGAILGLAGGLVGVFVMQRDIAFAVHGISELTFAGASAALLFGIDVITGSLIGSIIAAVLIGWLGSQARERNSIIGVIMPFGLGLGVLCLSLYNGRAVNKFGLLTGQIVSVENSQLGSLAVIAAVALVGLFLMWRPLRFDSMDQQSAAARGVPTRFVSFTFMLLLGLVVSIAVHIIGSLLVLTLVVTPAAAAMRISKGPILLPVLSASFGIFAAVAGIMLSVMGRLPVSPYITTISFVIYLVCRQIGRIRDRNVRAA